MKYLSLTFDDGREDNYSIAYPIMKQFGLCGTIYCTTGYIDGTWAKPEDWKSAEKPITIKELLELNNSGWEIALHGDKHTTEVNDFKISLQKMRQWGIDLTPIGFSMPNSNIELSKYKQFVEELFGNDLAYIRVGRGIDTRTLRAKILFVLSMFGVQSAYNDFNVCSINKMQDIDYRRVYSIVIRCKDDPKMLLKFLDIIPDESFVVLMLHSILPENHFLYSKDPWNWSEIKFKTLCNELQERIKLNQINVDTVINHINRSKEKCNVLF